MGTNDIAWLLQDLISTESINKITKVSGTDSNTTKKIISQALPELLKSVEKQAESDKSRTWLLRALENHSGEVFSKDVSIDATDGSKILWHIMWNSKKQELVEQLTNSLWTKKQDTDGVINSIAPLLMGSLWKATKSGNLDIGDLWKILSNSGSLKSNLLTSMLDKDGDGDIKDDLLNMGVNYIKKSFFKK